jgi:hypothetical protein
MQIDIQTALEGSAAAITAIGGAYSLIKRIMASSRKRKEKYRQAILDKANEEMAKIKAELEDKINALEKELLDQKASITKDLGYLKDTYSSEIKGLAQQIQDLKKDIALQHQALVGLLTKLVNGK